MLCCPRLVACCNALGLVHRRFVDMGAVVAYQDATNAADKAQAGEDRRRPGFWEPRVSQESAEGGAEGHGPQVTQDYQHTTHDLPSTIFTNPSSSHKAPNQHFEIWMPQLTYCRLRLIDFPSPTLPIFTTLHTFPSCLLLQKARLPISPTAEDTAPEQCYINETLLCATIRDML